MLDNTSQNQEIQKKDEKEVKGKEEGKEKEEEKIEKTEVKNANAAGQGAIGRTGEKPGPEMDGNMNY